MSSSLLRARSQLRSASSDSKTPPPRKSGEQLLKPVVDKFEVRPDKVSDRSSVRTIFEKSPPSAAKKDPDVGRDLKHDIAVFRDTFRLSDVPQESRILGLAGTLPYVATSLSTLFLAWDLNRDIPTGNSIFDPIFVDHETAQYLLNLIEPLQLGYGAVIISFLGAIHWGLEYAEKQPSRSRTRFRYGIGVAASIAAWPTVLMPIEHALTAQFFAFVVLYFVDARASSRGWAPYWYNTYRFLLTAIVGLAILVSLVGRAKISVHGRLSSSGLTSSMTTPGIADRETDWAKLEEEEKARIKKEEEEKAKKRKQKEAAERKKGGKKGGKNKDDQDKAKANATGTKDEEEADKKDDEEEEDSEDDEEGEEGEDGGKNEDDNNDEDGEDDEKKAESTNSKDDDGKDDDAKKDGKKKDSKAKDAKKQDNSQDDADKGDQDDADSKKTKANKKR